MQNDTGNAPKSLEPSELGTKEFWDKAYAREITNHGDDENDEGTIWFDENDAESIVIRLLDELSEQGLLQKTGPTSSRILDLGTGNGHMLCALREPDHLDEEDGEHTWHGEMIGVDYSEASIQLARQIVRVRPQHNELPHPQFEVWDILQETPGSWLKDGFDLVLDKGTFDAISLMSPQQEASSCDQYFKQVVPLVKPGGFLVLTSCNWTKEELFAWLEHSGASASLKFYQQGTYPTFTFGGQTGSSIVTIAFQKLVDGRIQTT